MQFLLKVKQQALLLAARRAVCLCLILAEGRVAFWQSVLRDYDQDGKQRVAHHAPLVLEARCTPAAQPGRQPHLFRCL